MKLPELAPSRPEEWSKTSAIILAHLVMRIVIGVLGLALPVVLIIGDWIVLKGGAKARGSLSAYYHSGMRDVFVGVLVVSGIFLITYKVLEKTWENSVSVLAGVAAIGVAVFPTGIPEASNAVLTPLQERIGEDTTKVIHFVCAVVFIVLLAALSYGFAAREGRLQLKRLHLICAGAILASAASIPVFKWLSWFDGYQILIGEIASLLAFGLSWLVKGSEWELLKMYRPSRLRPGGWPAEVGSPE